jgi:hypothetical protein
VLVSAADGRFPSCAFGVGHVHVGHWRASAFNVGRTAAPGESDWLLPLAIVAVGQYENPLALMAGTHG